MTSRDLHTDRAALKRQRQRAFPGEAAFVHEAAIDEMEYRLTLVNRTFTKPLLISGTPTIWQSAFP
ncbi:MAG: SAM-dependent methyltransferase, partial [Lentibacter algarum]